MKPAFRFSVRSGRFHYFSFPKLGAKHATFGEAWKKAWRAPLFRHRWLPPTSGLRSSGIVTTRSEATKQPGGSVTRPLGCFAPLARSSANAEGPFHRQSGRGRPTMRAAARLRDPGNIDIPNRARGSRSAAGKSDERDSLPPLEGEGGAMARRRRPSFDRLLAPDEGRRNSCPLTQTVSRKSGRGGLFGVARWSIGSVYV